MNILPYMGTTDLEEAYKRVKGSEEGMRGFIKDSRRVATKTKNGSFIYMDEVALYTVFESHLRTELNQHGIDCFGRLMQFIS